MLLTKTLSSCVLVCLAAVPLLAQGNPTPVVFDTDITAPGSYILTRDLVYNGRTAALTIRANDVTLDLAGFQITGPGNITGTGIMIDGASGVRVRNGYIRDLAFGVLVNNSNAVTLENLHIVARGLAVPAPPPEVGIMIVNSKAVVVTHNDLYNVGLGVFVRGPGSSGNHIYENTIASNTNGLLGVCYNPAPSGAPGGPRGDTVERNSISGFNFAIQVNAGGPNIYRDNTLIYKVGAFEMAEGTTAEDVNNTKVKLP
jgi:Periplasmic copper-binding protein (NosD)